MQSSENSDKAITVKIQRLLVSKFSRKCHPHVEPLLGSYNNRVHNFRIDFDSLANMYIPFFLQVVFPCFEKWKIIKSEKKVNFIKEISKDLEKDRLQRKKEIKIRLESEQVKMPLLFTFTARIMIVCRLSKMP